MHKAILQRAKQIMGTNFLGVMEPIDHFGPHFTTGKLLQETTNFYFNFTEETLQECKNTHVLFPGLPMTILDVRAKIKKDVFRQDESIWFNSFLLSNAERVAARWHLIRKDVAPDSRFKKPEEQLLLLGPKDIVPRACEFVYMLALYYFARSERLFPERYARCLEEADSEKPTIYIGFPPHGIHIDKYWGDCGVPSIGLASARKPDF